MKSIEKAEGIGGMLTAFRKLARGRKKITFIGCPDWCKSFAELLGYVLRDAGKEMAARLESTEYGLQLGEKAEDVCFNIFGTLS